jgi:hypothetical protein
MRKRLILLLGLFAAIGYLKADGKYFPEKAFQVPPQIPSQRAILAFKDGHEKLVIESTLDGQGQQFGWVIPVPAKPDSFEVVSPGLLESMSLVLQPRIIHDLGDTIGFISIIVSFITFLIFLRLFVFSGNTFGYVALFSLLFLFLIFLLTPSLEKAGIDVGTEVGVDVLDEQTVGNYTISVLSVENPEGLDQWLDENGFAGLSSKEKEIVADYIKKKWCFVASKLNREKEGLTYPHPIAINFTTPDAVYPMRLTGQTQSSVYLDLYVVSNQVASCVPLRQEVCNFFRYEKELRSGRDTEEALGGFTGGFDQTVGHPAVFQILWDGCVITRLSGQVKPEQMDKDYYIDWRPFESISRKIYFSQKGARSTGFIIGMLFWLVSLLVLVVSRRKNIQSAGGKLYALKKVIFPSAAGAILIGVVVCYCVPRTDVEASRGHRVFFNFRMYHTIEELLEKHPALLQKVDIESVQNYLEKENILSKYANYYTHKPMKIEDSPGNITIGQDDKSGLFIRTYNDEGFPENFYLNKYNKN